MDVFNTRALTQKQRFNVAVLVAVVGGLGLGILSGLFRKFAVDFNLILVGVGYLLALVVQKFGRGVQVKFSAVAAIAALFAILISDVVTVMGVAGLLDIRSYQIVIGFALKNDIHSVLWIAYRVFAIYIAYNYSRII